MQITTIRLPESMKAAIEQEAEEQELSPTEYMRSILRNRKQITIEDTAEESQGEYEGDYDQLEDRVTELEERVNQLEANPRDTNPTREATETREDDVVQWVRENQPVSKRDVIDEWHTEDMVFAELTWWSKRIKPALKTAGASHTRNIGWRFE